MARIRTIKPEFFTSEDIVSLSPLARLLYIATWCEADKEGRLTWKPRTFKLRYLPADNCDIDALADELVASGLVVLYGDGLAYIPGFAKHQHINPRETASTLPEPDASSTRRDASGRDIDAQGGREGKGKEWKGREYASVTDAPAPKPRKRSETTIAEWLATVDGDAIPADDPVFGYAAKVGIPADFLLLAWTEFEARHLESGKRYKDWRAAFRKCVRDNWYRLWWVDPKTGDYALTTQGVQAQRAAA